MDMAQAPCPSPRIPLRVPLVSVVLFVLSPLSLLLSPGWAGRRESGPAAGDCVPLRRR